MSSTATKSPICFLVVVAILGCIILTMKTPITFGWRVPDFPEGGADQATFRSQIFNFMDVLQQGGLDSAWVGDHFFPWPATKDQSLDTIEAWTTIIYLLSRYQKMRMGTIVLSQGYRPPALLAKMAANAQWLSGGRFILGIGAGWKQNEYRAYGYDFPSDPVRLDQLEEAVQIIRAMWNTDNPTFEGNHYHIQDAFCNPRPIPPPLLIGGAGPKRTLRIVAKYADWCNLNNATVEACKTSLDMLNQHCLSLGRNYADIVKTFACDNVAIAHSHSQAESMRQASFFGNMLPFTGTPDEVAATIQPYVDLGITHFILRWVDFPNTSGVELFMKEVMPRFA
jgi:alkanesulfonate monooxygenase SsuD/methylene tetrahydromethanopterin reductase-like flavin-dependent oxidoreductase (luciferase family)